jgi:hypothetical protein
MVDGLSRREFLGAAAGLAAAGGLGALGAERAGEAPAPSIPQVRIHVVYNGTSGGAWPSPKFDAAAEIALYAKVLAEAERSLPGVKLVGFEQVKSPDEAAKVAAGLKGDDALLIIDLNFDDGSRARPLVDAGLPTAIYFYPFSGHQWMYYSRWKKAGKRLLLLPTSDRGEIARAVRLLAVPGRLRKSRILVVGSPTGTAKARSAEAVRSRLGPEVVSVPFDRVLAVHKALDPKAIETDAEAHWLKQAKKVLEPTRPDILNSAALYLTLRKLLGEERAQAVTSSYCMGLPAKACLAFSRLNDEGLVGACEGDMDSTLTMLLFTYAFGVPGFITDPLFDLAKGAVVHAHCTAATRMDGPAGDRAPFTIRSQCDSEQGVSLEVEMRVGQEITCAKLSDLDTLLVSTGRITEIPDYQDRGCRTQIVTKVRDARKMLEAWGGGALSEDMMTLLHRVVFYGDRTRDVADLAGLLGIKVVEEA